MSSNNETGPKDRVYRGKLSIEALLGSTHTPSDSELRDVKPWSLRDRVFDGLGIKTYGDYRKKVENTPRTYPPTKEQRRIGIARMIADEMTDHYEMPLLYDGKTYISYGYYFNIGNDTKERRDEYGVRGFNVVYCQENDQWSGFAARTDGYESPYLMLQRDPEDYLAQTTPFASNEELVEFLLHNYEIIHERSLDHFPTAD